MALKGAPVIGDEGDVLLAVGRTSEEFMRGLELRIQELFRLSVNVKLDTKDIEVRKNILRGARNFMVWEYKFLRQTIGGLCVVSHIHKRIRIMRCLHK